MLVKEFPDGLGLVQEVGVRVFEGCQVELDVLPLILHRGDLLLELLLPRGKMANLVDLLDKGHDAFAQQVLEGLV